MNSNAEGPSEVTQHLAYAEASVMLLETIIEMLIERGVFAQSDVIEAVEQALESKKTSLNEGAHVEIARVAVGVLSRLANSMAASGRRPRSS